MAAAGPSQNVNEFVGDGYCLETFAKRRTPMAKTIETITDTIRNTKHPFRQADDRPKKHQKHRYERRKIREYLRLGDQLVEEPT